jgi:4-hydroxybenzoate polyprenyltransferase
MKGNLLWLILLLTLAFIAGLCGRFGVLLYVVAGMALVALWRQEKKQDNELT